MTISTIPSCSEPSMLRGDVGVALRDALVAAEAALSRVSAAELRSVPPRAAGFAVKARRSLADEVESDEDEDWEDEDKVDDDWDDEDDDEDDDWDDEDD